MKSLKYYFKKAEKQGWAIGQFNCANLCILKAIVQAAQKTKSPIIIGTSEGQSKFLGLKQAVVSVRSYRNDRKLSIFLNLDHGKSFRYIKKAIDAGYDAVHFDGSKLDIKENIKETRKVVKYAKRHGVLVEGEVGVIGGALTELADALKFIKATGVDTLAVSVGTIHGIKKPGRPNPPLNLKRLKEIKEKIGTVPLVLHGGSGTRETDIKETIKLGIVKININTELRMTYTSGLKKELKAKPKENTPYKYMPPVLKAVQKKVEEKIKLFGSVNKL